MLTLETAAEVLPLLLTHVPTDVRSWLDASGFRWAIVGGACRDTLIGVEYKDLDIAVWATDVEVASLALLAGWKPLPGWRAPAADMDAENEDTYNTFSCAPAPHVHAWSALPRMANVPEIWSFVFTLNCIGVDNLGQVFARPYALEHLTTRILLRESGPMFSDRRETRMRDWARKHGLNA